MRFSPLQKYIILECLGARGNKITRDKLGNFYVNREKKPRRELITKIISQSLERLIKKELIIGYGVRTSHKWFIREVKLTTMGVKEARKLLGEQGKLPFKE